jgi:hypothetical protein
MISKPCRPKMARRPLQSFKWLQVDYPTTERLMIEQQINNDQNNHRHAHQPAYKIFTHDPSPLKYSCILMSIYWFWLTFKQAVKRHHDASWYKVYWKIVLESVRCRTLEINCFICPDSGFLKIILISQISFLVQFSSGKPSNTCVEDKVA